MGRATRSIRSNFEPEIALADLKRAWSPLNLENHVHRLARPDLTIQAVLARRDTVVMPALSEEPVIQFNGGWRPTTDLETKSRPLFPWKTLIALYAGLSF